MIQCAQVVQCELFLCGVCLHGTSKARAIDLPPRAEFVAWCVVETDAQITERSSLLSLHEPELDGE